MTTTIDTATVAAEATATATTPAAAETLPVESQTADEAELGNTDPGEDGTVDDSEEDKVQAEVDRATRKARRRIDRLIADRAAAQERATRLEAELLEARKPAQSEDGTKPKPGEDPREIARQMRLAERTADALGAVMKEAKKFSDFDAAIGELVEELGPQIDQAGRPSPFMEAVLDLPPAQATDVIRHLGLNPELAAEFKGLSPAQIGRRIAKLEIELAASAKPKPSAAAKLLTPVKPSAVVTADAAKLTDAQWHAERKKAKLAG